MSHFQSSKNPLLLKDQDGTSPLTQAKLNPAATTSHPNPSPTANKPNPTLNPSPKVPSS